MGSIGFGYDRGRTYGHHINRRYERRCCLGISSLWQFHRRYSTYDKSKGLLSGWCKLLGRESQQKSSKSFREWSELDISRTNQLFYIKHSVVGTYCDVKSPVATIQRSLFRLWMLLSGGDSEISASNKVFM